MEEHGFSVNNPLGLPPEEQGRPHQLRIRAIAGEGHDTRLSAGAALCRLLNGRDGYITVFNSLTHPQQVIAVLIEEDSVEHPYCITEHYL